MTLKILASRKFTELREKDFQHYEMEKRFVEEQRLRHIKDEERRKSEQERMEAVKASQANRKVLISMSYWFAEKTLPDKVIHCHPFPQIKHPLTEDTAKEVWEEKEQLPKVALIKTLLTHSRLMLLKLFQRMSSTQKLSLPSMTLTAMGCWILKK